MALKTTNSAIIKGKEIYLLKIYRRGDNPSESLVGTIEDIKGKKRGVFKTEEALLRWLQKRKK